MRVAALVCCVVGASGGSGSMPALVAFLGSFDPTHEVLVVENHAGTKVAFCFGSAQKAGWIGAFKLLRRRVVGVDVCGFFERLPALGRVAGRWSSGGWQDDQLERYSQSRCEVGFGCNDLRMFW